jgi:hypothetical protein
MTDNITAARVALGIVKKDCQSCGYKRPEGGWYICPTAQNISPVCDGEVHPHWIPPEDKL